MSIINKKLAMIIMAVLSAIMIISCSGGEASKGTTKQELVTVSITHDVNSQESCEIEFKANLDQNIAVKFGETSVPKTSIETDENLLKIKATFLKQLELKNYTVQITIAEVDYMLSVELFTTETKEPTIQNDYLTFDHDSQADVQVNVEWNNSEFENLYLYEEKVDQSNYQISETSITLKKDYLKDLNYKTLEFSVENGEGSSAFVVKKENILYLPVSSDTSLSYDYKLFNSEAGLVWNVALACEEINYIKIGETELTVDDYKVELDKITIFTLPTVVGEYDLVISTTGGQASVTLICEDNGAIFNNLQYLLDETDKLNGFEITFDFNSNTLREINVGDASVDKSFYTVNETGITFLAQFFADKTLPLNVELIFDQGYEYTIEFQSNLVLACDFDTTSILNTDYFGLDVTTELVENGITGKSAKITASSAGTLLAIGTERFPYDFKDNGVYVIKFDMKLLKQLSGASLIFSEIFMPVYFGSGKDVAYINSNTNGQVYLSPQALSESSITYMTYDKTTEIYSFSIGFKPNGDCLLLEIPIWMDSSFLFDNLEILEVDNLEEHKQPEPVNKTVLACDFDSASIIGTNYFGLDVTTELVENGIDGKSAKITSTGSGTLLAIGTERYPYDYVDGEAYTLKFQMKFLEKLSGISSVYGDLFMPIYFGSGKDVAYLKANTDGVVRIESQGLADSSKTSMTYDENTGVYSFEITFTPNAECLLLELPVWMPSTFLVDNIELYKV